MVLNQKELDKLTRKCYGSKRVDAILDLIDGVLDEIDGTNK